MNTPLIREALNQAIVNYAMMGCDTKLLEDALAELEAQAASTLSNQDIRDFRTTEFDSGDGVSEAVHGLDLITDYYTDRNRGGWATQSARCVTNPYERAMLEAEEWWKSSEQLFFLQEIFKRAEALQSQPAPEAGKQRLNVERGPKAVPKQDADR